MGNWPNHWGRHQGRVRLSGDLKGNCPQGAATTHLLLIVPIWEYEPSLARSLSIS